MKIAILAACIFTTTLLTSCGGNPPAYEENSTQLPASTFSDSSLNSSTTTTNVGENNNAPATLPASAAPVTGINPQHGAPGHRCDIEVGAPLNSPAQKVNATSQLPSTLPQPVKSAPGKGMPNPAHGLPGHDCSIPVGQPLS